MENQNARKKVMIAAVLLLGIAMVGGLYLRRGGDSQTGDSADTGSLTAPANSESTESTASDAASADRPSGIQKSGSAAGDTEKFAAQETGANGSAVSTGGSTEKDKAGAQTTVAAPAPKGGLAGLKAKVLGLFGVGSKGVNDLGTTSPAGGVAIQTGGVVKPTEPKIDLSKNCFTETFTQKSNLSVEALANRRNLLKLKYADVNPKAVCVRVNGTPVAYSLRAGTEGGKLDEVLIGPVAAPTAKIVVRYCMVKMTCNEDCNVPKDEFLEAIGGVADAGEVEGKNVKWDPEEQGGDDVEAGLDPEVKRELANHADMKVFNGWMSDGAEAACGTKPIAGHGTARPHS